MDFWSSDGSWLSDEQDWAQTDYYSDFNDLLTPDDLYETKRSLIIDFFKQSVIDSFNNFWSDFVRVILLSALVFRVCNLLAPRQRMFYHCFCIIWGVSSVILTDSTHSLVCFISFAVVSFIVSTLTRQYFKNHATIFTGFNIIALFSLSFYFPNWTSIRGVFMVMAMKYISVAYDLRRKKMLNLSDYLAFFGYIFSGANFLLGPWIDYEKHHKYNAKTPTFKEIRNVCGKIIKAMFYLFMLGLGVIFSTNDHNIVFKMYRQALQFRLSNYFICELSEIVCLIAGYEHEPVTEAYTIEFPRSIVDVVSAWNIPMHLFLKKYIFTDLKRYHPLISVLGVYTVSSALHGFTGGITTVLLQLGLYSYAEYSVRQKLSSKLNACCRAKMCVKCNHTRKSTSIVCVLINGVFYTFAQFILTYTGFVFDRITSEQVNDEYAHCLAEWSDVYFCGLGLTAILIVADRFM